MTTGHEPGTCSWCGLPVATSWFLSRPSVESSTLPDADSASNAPAPDDEFCCFGCRFAAQVTQDRGESGQVQWTLTRLGIAIFFTMNVMVFTMALWSQDVYDVDRSQILVASLSELFRWLCFVSATPVLFLLGVPIAVAACAELSRGRVTTDLLVVVGVVAAFVYSVAALLQQSDHIYFEVASMVLVLITLGRWLEASGKLHTGELLDSLERIIPETSRLLLTSGEVATPTADIKPGDRVLVLAGERIPVDGVLEHKPETGQTPDAEIDDPSSGVEIDQQILTGESAPVTRRSGEEVVSGTVPVDSTIVVRVTRPAHEGTLALILDAVRRARSERGQFQKSADLAASWFVPFVAVVAVSVFAGNVVTGSLADGVLASLAVTLIACPCALGLATSVAVWTAMRRAAERGVLFRNGEVLERLSTIKAVRFDKTGTLTSGKPCVAGFVCRDEATRERVASIARSMAHKSTHSFSKAIAAYLSGRNRENCVTTKSEFDPKRKVPDFTVHKATPSLRIQRVRTVSGFGLEATLVSGVEGSDETIAWLGSLRFLESEGCELNPHLKQIVESERQGAHSIVLIGWANRVQGIFTLREDVRDEAAWSVDACRRLNLNMGILSGDLAVHAERLGAKLGVSATGALLPEDKLADLKTTQQNVGPVLMVGDGINDSPAMAGADVAASLGSGADLSRDAAGVCLLRDDLSCVPWMIALSRQTRRVIRQNLFWAFGYNTVGMALAATGMLNPVLAATVMFGSSAFVLWNSRRLASFELPGTPEFARKPPALSRLEPRPDTIGEVLGA